MASPQNVSIEQVRQILSEVVEALESPDYASKLDEAKEAAGNEMLKMMQIVFPMVVQIEMEIIKKHGFSNSREACICPLLNIGSALQSLSGANGPQPPASNAGIVQFTQIVRETENLDAEVTRVHNQIRCHYLPPVSISSTVDTSL